jgi:DNA-binding transcriptional ArsR family regulator
VDAIRAVAEPRRREILRLVWDAERPATEIAEHFDITFGAVSQHLGVLRSAGLVVVRRDGTRRFYRANREALRPFAAMLHQMWAEQLDELAGLAEAAEERSSATAAEASSGTAAEASSGTAAEASSGTAEAASAVTAGEPAEPAGPESTEEQR